MDTADNLTSLALINRFYALSVLLFLHLKIVIHEITLQIRFPGYTVDDDHPRPPTTKEETQRVLFSEVMKLNHRLPFFNLQILFAEMPF